jgi:hypothetical protein
MYFGGTLLPHGIVQFAIRVQPSDTSPLVQMTPTQIGYDAPGWRSFGFWAFGVEPYELLKGPMTMAQKGRTLAS